MKKIILSSFIFIFLLNLSSCDFFQSKNMFSNGEDTLMHYKMKQDSLRFVDSIQKLQGKLQHMRNRHQTILDSLKKAKSTNKSDYKFHIIVGSFRNKEYLDSYNQYITDKGFKTTILENQHGFKLISVESSNSWRKSVATLNSIRDDLDQNAWIYIDN